jgi:putative N-acetyltransferase (TIGR04045 family)
MATVTQPSVEYLERMYKTVGQMLYKKGLHSDNCSSGCVKCKACSGLQFTENGDRDIQVNKFKKSESVTETQNEMEPCEQEKPILKIAESESEINGYFRIRKEVFVEEQAVFRNSDIDKHDKNAIPIIATLEKKIIGAVRCYPKTSKIWHGGRLAVKKEFRKHKIGMLLVRKAVETMNNHPEVETFLATIQLQNVRLFKRLGWIRKGEVFMINGKKHQLMERILKKKRDED